MKPPTTDLSTFDVLQGEGRYEFSFQEDALNTEVLVDIYSDKAVSLHFQIVRDGTERWVPMVGGERRIELRGRFAHLKGCAISASKEAVIYAFVRAIPVQVAEQPRQPRVAHLELPKLSPEMAAVQEMRKELRRMFPEKFKDKTPTIDPELMGDEIPTRAGAGYEIEDDDDIDPLPGFERVREDEPAGDPGAGGDRAGEDPGRRPTDQPTAPDPRGAAPAADPAGQPNPEVKPVQRDRYFG